MRAEDLRILGTLPEGKPVILVINKIDKVKPKSALFPVLIGHAKAGEFAAVIPMSALRADGVRDLVAEVKKLLPEGPPLFEDDSISDKPVRFFVAELVREQILRKTREEVPHGVAVVVEQFDESGRIPKIDLAIHVDMETHKRIVIGREGALLKSDRRPRARRGSRSSSGGRCTSRSGCASRRAGTRATRSSVTRHGLRRRAARPPKKLGARSRTKRIKRPRRSMRTRAPHARALRGLPIVAIVGRPNVGKSTLFNRLARTQLAIVHDEPGVTRDRHYADTTAFGRGYTLIDTGGFDPESDDPMKSGIAKHVKAAIAEADAIVFVTDATTELTTADLAAVKLLRRANKPVIYAANKADSSRVDADAMELYRLGVKNVIPISALHGRGIGDLEAAIVEALPPEPTIEVEDDRIPRIAIVGRPNAGKSSLMNRVLGEDRMLVDDQPGTTHDSIDAMLERGDRRYVFIDTAGIRRKGKVTKAEDTIESLSVLHAIRSMERAQVVVLMCDAKEGVSEQDAKILGLAEERGRAMVIVLNKIDLVKRDELKKAEENAREKISFAPYVPVVRISAKTGRGVKELFETIDEVREAYTKRIGTGELNRFFESVLETHPPPTSGGRAPRLYYVTQAESSPPAFIAVSNAPDSIHFSYRRFVVNQFRKHFGFEGVPIRVFYKAKRKREGGGSG